MRALLFRLSLAVACAGLVVPAYAQDKPPADDRPAQPDRDARDKEPPPPPVKDVDRDRPADKAARADVKAQRVSGKIVSVENDQVILRTEAGKEMTLIPSAQTRYTIDGRAARFADYRVGTVVDAAYVVDRDRYVLNSLIVGEVPARPAEPAPPADKPAEKGTLVEGTVVKVVGNDQVIVKTSDGKEITIHVSPQTKYTLTQQGGAFVDLTPNMPVRMYYETIDRRPVARSVLRATTAPVRPRRP